VGEVICDYTLGTYTHVDRLSTIMQKTDQSHEYYGLKKIIGRRNQYTCMQKITKKETDENLKIIRGTILINY
jgi:hypothetical protein